MSANPDSILDSIKKALGIEPEIEAFDLEIVMFTNSVFGSLQQLGVGPDSGFLISDNTTLWAAYTARTDYLGMIKTYMCMKVRLLFDPPATSYAISAIESQTQQLEWRINVMAESTPAPDVPASTWWDLTGLSDFPDGSVTGDYGIDTSNGDVYVCNSVVAQGYFWDITGLSDFPTDAFVGELGIDMATGDVWRKTA